MKTRMIVLLTIALFAANASAQTRGGGAAGAAPTQAPPRPRIEAINNVWIEELTQPELRDMLRYAPEILTLNPAPALVW